MKKRLLTPGPSPVPEDTLLELARPVPYHRTAEFRKVMAEVLEDLQYVFRTKNPILTLASSGTGAMEAAVVNCMPRGKKAICLISGRFGDRWRNLAKAFGGEAIAVVANQGNAVAPEQLARALAEHPDSVAVFSTLSDTSTGVANDIAAFGKLVASTPAVLVVDAISSLGVMECQTDDWHVDVCVTGSQKALMLPPGLAFLSVSDKAWKQIDANVSMPAFYFDLRKYKSSLQQFDTPFTPAHTLVMALGTSLKRIRAEGIEKVWARHATLAKATRAAIEALGLELFAKRPADGLTVAYAPAGIDSTTILGKLEKQYGFKLANGQDQLKGKIFRLAHMGYTDQFDILGALSALELVLLELGHKVAPGVAVTAAQREFAKAVPVAGKVQSAI